MEIKLPEALERFVQEQVDRGLYSTASEVVNDLVRRAMEKQAAEDERKLAELRAFVQAGIDQADRGEFVDDFDIEELIDEIDREEAAQREAV